MNFLGRMGIKESVTTESTPSSDRHIPKQYQGQRGGWEILQEGEAMPAYS